MEPNFGYVSKEGLGLWTDLYELTMMQGYIETDHNPRSTFELYFRELPDDRGYIVAAGLEQAVHYLENIEFGEGAIEYLAEQGFDDKFLNYLEEFEFTGDVRAVPEGTPVFPNEPLIEVTAPIVEAQLLETLLINQVGFQSLIASKAARMRDVVERMGDGQALVDFGSRRAHGTDAGMKAARASYIGGFAGTSNVAAGKAFGIPIFGTMAHSWIESYESEHEAFRDFVEVYGEDSILLVDTYDTVRGAERAVEVAEETGVDIRGVRLDSGDLAVLSKEVDELVGDIGVFISSGVDEYKIERFLESGGVATGFGVGTKLVTSRDAPSLDIVYKIMEVERGGEMEPVMKLSSGKVTYPGQKTVQRIEGDDGYRKDVLGLRGEDLGGRELLVDVFREGERVTEIPSLDELQTRVLENIDHLPDGCRQIRSPIEYEVQVSDRLQDTMESLEQKLLSGDQ